MATKIAVTLEDDLDGDPADETVRLAIGGTEYEIDLSEKKAKTFRKRLAPFTEHARKTERGQHRRPARTSAARERSGDIRAWAKAKGILTPAALPRLPPEPAPTAPVTKGWPAPGQDVGNGRSPRGGVLRRRQGDQGRLG